MIQCRMHISICFDMPLFISQTDHFIFTYWLKGQLYTIDVVEKMQTNKKQQTNLYLQ